MNVSHQSLSQIERADTSLGYFMDYQWPLSSTLSVRVSIILHQQIAYVLVRRTAMFLVLARNFSGTQLAHAEKFSSDSNDRV